MPGTLDAAAVAMAPVTMYERWAVCIDMRRARRSLAEASTMAPSLVTYGPGGATKPTLGSPGDRRVASLRSATRPSHSATTPRTSSSTAVAAVARSISAGDSAAGQAQVGRPQEHDRVGRVHDGGFQATPVGQLDRVERPARRQQLARDGARRVAEIEIDARPAAGHAGDGVVALDGRAPALDRHGAR